MPAKKGANDAEIEEAINALSCTLRKSHGPRTDALFIDDDVCNFLKQEADRASLDPNMILVGYFAVLSHLLNPGALSHAPLPVHTPFLNSLAPRVAHLLTLAPCVFAQLSHDTARTGSAFIRRLS
jgi:hypothetical protein